jgi:LDH2 family malate/lactate/ureidoglycolate dehydrogenase
VTSDVGAEGLVAVEHRLVRNQIRSVLLAWGAAASAAETVSAIMADADLSGIDSHGVSMLMMYERLISEGRLVPSAGPELLRSFGASRLVTGNRGFGHLAGQLAADQAVIMATESGVGAVSVVDSNHFGALGYFARRIALAGCVAVVCTTTYTPAVSVVGGNSPVLGTNPIAFAAPRTGAEPVVVDMSTSVVALNKVKAYMLAGHALPVGWVVDQRDEAMLDAAAAYAALQAGEASLSPLGGKSVVLGGHKGYGLAVMSEILSSVFGGWGGQYASRGGIGHFVLALQPELISGDTGGPDGVAGLAARLVGSGTEVLIPGDPERIARQNHSVSGVPMPTSLVALVRRVCERAGAEFILSGREF